MVQFPVVCPQCGQTFTVPSNRKKGKCAHCSTLLLFEKIPIHPPREETREQAIEIDLLALENTIDGTIREKSIDPHVPQVQDIAVISDLASPKNYSQITKRVNKLLSARG